VRVDVQTDASVGGALSRDERPLRQLPPATRSLLLPNPDPQEYAIAIFHGTD